MPLTTSKPVKVSVAHADAIRDVLQRYWGFDTLRPLQADSIHATLAGRDSLTVLATGGGKSLCYQVPPLVTGKLTLVVSPLISLMQDQVAGLRMAGVPAAAAHGNLSAQENAELRDAMRSGELRVLLTAPERLLTPGVMSWLVKQDIGAIAIDEAHCISQWGHDFRPEYRRLAELREALPDVPLGAYTATATPRVREDIIRQLQLRDPVVIVGSADRPNLTYRILPRIDEVDQIVEALNRHKDAASIVYCISRKDTETLAAALKARRVDAAAYHAGLDATTRSRLSRDFRDERLRVVCATVAFGMGIDRADVRCVIHAAMPKSIEGYQQETGRAGRDGLPSECLMLYGAGDVARWRRVLDNSDSSPENVQAQFELLEEVHRLVASPRCRHAALCEHFGEQYQPPEGATGPGCGACDFCLGELVEVDDAHDTARKILSCVARCGQMFGAAHIADVLRAARLGKIIEKGHDKLSTYGLLRHLSKSRIVGYIDQLVDMGHLERGIGQFPTLRLGHSAMRVLRNEITVSLREAKVNEAEASQPNLTSEGRTRIPLTDAERRMFDGLRHVRTALAAELNVAPFMVLHDATLEDLCRFRPSTTANLSRIKGLGAKKIASIGDQLLIAIREHAAAHNLPLDTTPAQSDSPTSIISRPAPSKPRQRPAASHAAHALFAEGKTVDEAMDLLGRARSTTFQYLADYIAAEKPPSISTWVSDSDYQRIDDAIRAVQAEAPLGEELRLAPVYTKLNEEVGFELIRIVMLHRSQK